MMLMVVAFLAAVMFVLMLSEPSTEPYVTRPTTACRPAILQRNRLQACLAAAVDRQVPVTPGKLQGVPVDDGMVAERTRTAVHRINQRCGLDLYQMYIDGGRLERDELGNGQWRAVSHVYSMRFNICAALDLTVLQPAGDCAWYLTGAATISVPDNDTSGVEAAGPHVFDASFSAFDSF